MESPPHRVDAARLGPWSNARPELMMVGFAVVYALAVVVGRMSRMPGTSLALVWPAAAVAFLWILWASHLSRRLLVLNALTLTVVVGAVNWATGAQAGVAVAFAAANLIQALVECAVLRRVRPSAWRLDRASDLWVWVIACACGAAVSALIGPSAVVASSGGSYWAIAGAWTLRNATNAFVFGALALRIAGQGLPRLPSRRGALELAAASVVLSVGYLLVFGMADGLPLAYAVLPLSMWISLRFSTTLAAGHVLTSAVFVVAMTMSGRGPFAFGDPAVEVLLAQAYVAIVGLVTLVLALLRDERQALIADLRLARARADETSARLAEASRQKSDFLTTMSHEIRTPLNGVLGFTALLAESPTDPAAAEWARSADTAGRNLLTIVNNGLDLAKIEAGAVELESVELDLVTVAREAMIPSQLTAAGKGVDLHLVIVDGLHRSRLGDPVRLRQILTNLVANAVKFTERGAVTVTVGGAGDDVEINVADTGIGMTPEQQERLFAPFQQASSETTRRYGGTGLGLSIAKSLTETMGGSIAVSSTAGEGSTFTVRVPLPRRLGQAVEAPIATTGPRNEELLAGLRVLVAEDNPVNQMLARATLQARGLLVDVVDDGAPAVEAALTGRYAAVFMDCQMPGLDGLDATRRIRSAEPGAPIPVIAMTAGAFHEDRQACLAAGMTDFLPKPWKREELDDVLARLADHQLQHAGVPADANSTPAPSESTL
jgi:signal transduction histidine kinase/ActR/RegA family two-component response regulator